MADSNRSTAAPLHDELCPQAAWLIATDLLQPRYMMIRQTNEALGVEDGKSD
jgi:hypothetical protein